MSVAKGLPRGLLSNLSYGPQYQISLSVDTDGDGIPNNRDSDADGVSDFIESGAVDSNGDGHADSLITESVLTDTDSDGVVDVYEANPRLILRTGRGCSLGAINSAASVSTDPLLLLLGLFSLVWLQRRCFR